MIDYDRRQEDVQLAVVVENVKYLVREVDKINTKLEGDYVTQDQFEPIKKIVYGLVGIILVAVVGALVAIVIK